MAKANIKDFNIFLHVNDLPSNIVLGNEIAIDTETMGLNLNTDRLCLLQLKDSSNNIHLVHFVSDKYDAPVLKEILQNERRLKIFHFARFDVLAIEKFLNIKFKNIFCTKIASKLCRTYTDKHSLFALCDEILDIQLNKKQQSSDWGRPDLTINQQVYAAFDVAYLHKIKDYLQSMLIRENKQALALECFDVIPTLCKLDDIGMMDDKDVFKH